MGCSAAKIPSYSLYSNISEENNIRKWEEGLDLNKKKFRDLIVHFNSFILILGEAIPFKLFDDYLDKHFKGDTILKNLCESEFIKTKQKKVNCEHIKFLFLLLSSPSRGDSENELLDNNEINNCFIDKVEYLHSYLVDEEGNYLRKKQLIKKLKPLVQIACKLIPQYYKNSKVLEFISPEEEKYFSMLEESEERITENFITDLFRDKNELSVNDLEKKYEENYYVLNKFN
jgi:hypothetical protein